MKLQITRQQLQLEVCPACRNRNVDTGMYAQIDMLLPGDTLCCSSCKAEYLLRNRSGHHSGWEWEMMEENK